MIQKLLSLLIVLMPIMGKAQSGEDLAWPDQSEWETRTLNEVLPGLKVKMPKDQKIFAHDHGITIFITEDVIYSIDMDDPYNDFSMEETRQWLEDAVARTARQNLEWRIDEEHRAYYTGEDLSAPEGNQTTHSCYAEKKINGHVFTMEVDGITIDGDSVYNLSETECLMFLAIFDSIHISE